MKRLLCKAANWLALKLGDWLGDQETEKGEHFADLIQVVEFPKDRRKWLYTQTDDDNWPKGTLVASYWFEHGQEIYEQK